MQAEHASAETYGNIQEIIAGLKAEIKQLQENPNLPVCDSTRRLRQRYFKAKHRQKHQKKETINLELSLACPTSSDVEPLQVVYPTSYTGYEEIYTGFVSDSDEQEPVEDAQSINHDV